MILETELNERTTPAVDASSSGSRQERVVMRDLDNGVSFTMEHVEIMRHTLRNRLYCGGSQEMDYLVERGYMAEAGRKSFVPDMYYSLTAKGKAVLNAAESA